MSTGSVVNQTTRAMNGICVFNMSEKHKEANNIPSDKHTAKKQGIVSRYIYSKATMKRYLKSCCQFVRYCRQNYDIDLIKDINKDMAVSWLEKRRGEVKAGTLQNDKAAINKLDTAIKQMGWKSKHDPSFKIEKEDIKIPQRNIKNKNWGGRYTPGEVKKIFNYLQDHSPTVYKLAKFQHALGLRVDCEALSAKIKDRDLQENRLSTVGKNGKYREIQIPEWYIPELEELIKDKDLEESIITGTKERNAQKQIKLACEKEKIQYRGTHGLRGSAAYRRLIIELDKRGLEITTERYNRLLNDDIRNLPDKEKKALRNVSRFLGHNRLSVVRNHYLTREM